MLSPESSNNPELSRPADRVADVPTPIDRQEQRQRQLTRDAEEQAEEAEEFAEADDQLTAAVAPPVNEGVFKDTIASLSPLVRRQLSMLGKKGPDNKYLVGNKDLPGIKAAVKRALNIPADAAITLNTSDGDALANNTLRGTVTPAGGSTSGDIKFVFNGNDETLSLNDQQNVSRKDVPGTLRKLAEVELPFTVLLKGTTKKGEKVTLESNMTDGGTESRATLLRRVRVTTEIGGVKQQWKLTEVIKARSGVFSVDGTTEVQEGDKKVIKKRELFKDMGEWTLDGSLVK